MSVAVKRIETSLPDNSYQIVSHAAEMCGMSLRSFFAKAVLDTAMATIERINATTAQTSMKLNHQESQKLKYLLDHPELFNAGLEKIMNMAILTELPVKKEDEL